MRMIKMSLDEELVKKVDIIASELNMTRSAFTQDALLKAVRLYDNRRLELNHRRGYETQPINQEEFIVWEEEQSWGD